MKRLVLSALTLCAVWAGEAVGQPEEEWVKFYGYDYESFEDILQVDDGYIVAGYTTSFGEGGDGWLVKTNQVGDSIWAKTYGGEDQDWISQIIKTQDGGFALGCHDVSPGLAQGDMLLVKLDCEGNTIWSRTYGGIFYQSCNSIIQLHDGGFALAGYSYTYNVSNSSFWLVRTNTDGDSLWSRTYGGGFDNRCISILPTVNDGFAMAGFTGSYTDHIGDLLLVVTNSDGDSLWSFTFDSGDYEELTSFCNADDGGFILAGWELQSGSFIVKCDSIGELEWSKFYQNTICQSIRQVESGGFILSGFIETENGLDIWLHRMSDNGDSLWSGVYNIGKSDWCNVVIQTIDGGFALAGYTFSPDDFNASGWLLKTGPDPLSAPDSDFSLHPSSFILYPAYPNPFNSATTIRFALPRMGGVSLEAFDTAGRSVGMLTDRNVYPTGVHCVTWDASGLPAGEYVIQLTGEDGLQATSAVTLVK